MSLLKMGLRMSNGHDRNLLTKRFYDYEDDIETNPTTRKLNDHILVVDGFNSLTVKTLPNHGKRYFLNIKLVEKYEVD